MAGNIRSPFRIYRRGDTWHAYISLVVAGRRIIVRETTGCQDPQSATDWCIKRIQVLQKTPVATHEITLDAAAEKWWTEHGQYLVKPESVFNRIKNLLTEFNPDLLLSEISKMDITRFVSQSQARGRSPATINRYLCLLSAMCTRAKEFWDCRVPEYRILSFKLKEPKENIKYFKDWNEIQAILDHAAPHLRPIIQTALYTGLRLGRILSLRWEQIDWSGNQIVYMGKDGRQHAVPMVPALRAVLQEIPRHGANVFNYAGHPITRISVSWQKALQRAGVPYRNFHALRHTTATWLLKQTGNLRLVQNVLDHHSINTTTKYAHLVDSEAAVAMGQVFDK